MSKVGLIKIAVLCIILLLVSACSFGPPPECSAGLGGTANETLFAQYFNSMELVSQTSGQTGGPADSGVSFIVSEPLVIKLDSRGDVAVRACVQFFTGNTIVYDQTTSVVADDNQISLGSFGSAGSYVVRVIVDGALVKNLPFTLIIPG